MKTLRALIGISAMFLFSSLFAEPLKVGDQAPAVAAVTHDGTTLNLGDIYPKGFTVVFFYPKANTSGCTAQACSLRDSFEVLTEKGVTVIGVSTDGVPAQKKFRDDHNLPFTLLADTEKTVVNAFGVPTTMGFAARQAFLINREGRIVWADQKASTKKQAEDVLSALARQGG